jgi:hypothetical protein
MLKAAFVRTEGERDRIYVTRSDGSEVSWIFPTYGDAPPHDMIHLIVESAFGVTQGFWGRVDSGADPGRIAEEANRIGGPNKYRAFGAGLSGLALAEILANAGWLTTDDSAEALTNQIHNACCEAGLTSPALLSKERAAKVRDALKDLAGRWRGLMPKGAIHLIFDPLNPDHVLELAGIVAKKA